MSELLTIGASLDDVLAPVLRRVRFVEPDVEDTFVDISMNGVDWLSVGKVLGATSSIDIDAFGYGPTDFFSWVRLTDDSLEGGVTGITVGAISSAPPVPAPEPVTLLLLGTGLLGSVASLGKRSA